MAVHMANDCALEESDDVMECDTSAFEGVLCDSSLIGISDPEMHVVVFLAGYICKKLRSRFPTKPVLIVKVLELFPKVELLGDDREKSFNLDWCAPTRNSCQYPKQRRQICWSCVTKV